jgi:hypothetical protein
VSTRHLQATGLDAAERKQYLYQIEDGDALAVIAALNADAAAPSYSRTGRRTAGTSSTPLT